MHHGTANAMVTFVISARSHDLAFLQGILEASEGLAVIHGVRGGAVTVVTPMSRAAETRALLADLREERGLIATEQVSSPVAQETADRGALTSCLQEVPSD